MAYQPCPSQEPHGPHWLGEENGSTDMCPGLPTPPPNPNPNGGD